MRPPNAEDPRIEPYDPITFDAPVTRTQARRSRTYHTGSPDLLVSLSRSGRSVRLFTGLGDSHPHSSIGNYGLELNRDA
jgi:hypothetical protein